MYTGQGRGWREGASWPPVGWGSGRVGVGGRRVTRQGRGKGLWGTCVCVCGRVRLGIFFDISRRYCIVFLFFFLSFVVYFQKLLFHFFIFLGYEE